MKTSKFIVKLLLRDCTCRCCWHLGREHSCMYSNLPAADICEFHRCIKIHNTGTDWQLYSGQWVNNEQDNKEKENCSS